MDVIEKEKRVFELVTQYFKNKDLSKYYKKRRVSRWSCDQTTWEDDESHPTNCIDDMRKGLMTVEQMCSGCKLRHHAHKEIKRLGSANSGIMRSLRHLTTDKI